MNKFKRSYFAGYFDGDGCFYIGKINPNDRKTIKYTQQIIITSTDKSILEYLKANFGGTIQIGKKYIGREQHKIVYYYSINKKNGINFTNNIVNHLVEKQNEAITFLEFCRSTNKETLIQEMNILKDSNTVNTSMKNEFESIRNTITPTTEDFAYLAGLIDAECSLGIQKYRSKNKPNYLYKTILQCNNTKFPIFKWLLERFGGQIHFIDRNSKNINHRNQLTWRLSSNALACILDKILPFLKYKKPVCQKLIEFQKTILSNGGKRNGKDFKSNYQSIIKIREKIVHNIHILNKKGI